MLFLQEEAEYMSEANGCKSDIPSPLKERQSSSPEIQPQPVRGPSFGWIKGVLVSKIMDWCDSRFPQNNGPGTA